MDHLPLVVHQADAHAGSSMGVKSAFLGSVQNLLGDNIAVSRDPTGHRIGAPHATTGIPYAISGTASVIQSSVSAKLATFTDPIKAILGTGVHNSQRIIIRRKYVAGGGAHIVPEHASARTVAIREDVREVMLSRYGNDIEMNLNLFLRPQDAEEELTMKLEASQIALEKRLVQLGYEAIMDNGVDLATAIARSRNQMSLSDMSTIYCRQLFGVMAKSAYPITTIMAAAKMANAYAVSSAEKTVMIVPFGTPEIIKYTKPHWMEYNLSGVPANTREKLDLKIPGGRIDEFTNCTIYQHVPPVDMSDGVPHPIVEDSMLSRYVTVISRIALPPAIGAEHPDRYIINYKTGDPVRLPRFSGTSAAISENGKLLDNEAVERWHSLLFDDNTAAIRQKRADLECLVGATHYIRRSRFKMLSGILAAPGAATGELLYAYSSCSVSTNPSTELGKLGLRVYLGAAIYKPENIFILPNIAFESVVSDVIFPAKDLRDGTVVHHKENHSSVAIFRNQRGGTTTFDNNWICTDNLTDMSMFKDGLRYTLYNSSDPDEQDEMPNFTPFDEPYTSGGAASVLNRSCQEHFCDQIFRPHELDSNVNGNGSFNLNLNNCAVYDESMRLITHNTGPLGDLDTIAKIGRLNGLIEFNEGGPANAV